MDADLREERGRACAQFIDVTIKEITTDSAFCDPNNNPLGITLQTWELILHSRGVKSQIHLFTEPGRFRDAESPFERITAVSPHLQWLHRIFVDPTNEIDKIHTNIASLEKRKRFHEEEIQSFLSILAGTPKDVPVPELLKRTMDQTCLQLGRTSRELKDWYGILFELGLIYSLIWHWLTVVDVQQIENDSTKTKSLTEASEIVQESNLLQVPPVIAPSPIKEETKASRKIIVRNQSGHWEWPDVTAMMRDLVDSSGSVTALIGKNPLYVNLVGYAASLRCRYREVIDREAKAIFRTFLLRLYEEFARTSNDVSRVKLQVEAALSDSQRYAQGEEKVCLEYLRLRKIDCDVLRPSRSELNKMISNPEVEGYEPTTRFDPKAGRRTPVRKPSVDTLDLD